MQKLYISLNINYKVNQRSDKIKIITLTIVIINLLILNGSLLATSIEDSNTLNLTKNDIICCSDPEIIEYNKYTALIINETTVYLKNPEKLIVPIIIKTYVLPMGSIIDKVSLEPNGIKIKQIFQNIKSNEMYFNDANFEEDLYPDKWYEYSIGVGLNGTEHVTYLKVHCYPVHYSQSSGLLYYTNCLNVSINYSTPSNLEVFPNKCDLVIISPLKFSFPFKKLVKHKEDMGIKTKLFTTNEIYKKYNGADKAEEIKLFICDAVKNYGAKYILLFGGMRGQNLFSWYIPARYSHLNDASGERYDLEETCYISDLYYSDIFKYDNISAYIFDDWDSNNNGVFAEWNKENKDILDLYPDVHVGRIPCRYLIDANSVINKIIKYEKTTYNQNWFNKITVIGADSFNDSAYNVSTDNIEGQMASEHVINYMDQFEATRLWVKDGDVDLNTKNIKTVFSKGQGFAYFAGHGNPIQFVTYPPGNFNDPIKFGIRNIKKLRNYDKLPILLVSGCHSCQFDVSVMRLLKLKSIIGGEASPKCWGWSFVTLNKRGSIATIGNTGLSYAAMEGGNDSMEELHVGVPDGVPDFLQYLGGWLETHFFQVYNQDGRDILGETHGMSITDYLNRFPIFWDIDWDTYNHYSTLQDIKTVQQWVLLGDPSLKVGGYNLI